MSIQDNPKNYTFQLMRAQESRVLLGKISNARPLIDNKSPKYQGSVGPMRNPSRSKNISRRREIEIENNALIQKMLKIMQVNFKQQCILKFKQRGTRSTNTSPMHKKNHSNSSSSAQLHNISHLPGGGVPAHLALNQSLNITQLNQQSIRHANNLSMLTSNSQQNSPGKVGSLNYYKRKKDIDHINQTNQQLLKALQNVKPSVNRGDLKNHESRIKKLKQHIGQVRYGSPPNFVFPVVSHNENHNYHSSQFVFVKNPSQINLRSSGSRTRQRSSQNLTNISSFAANQIANLEIRPQTSQAQSRKRLRNQQNQSADFNRTTRKSELLQIIQNDDLQQSSRISNRNLKISATGAIDEQISRQMEDSPNDELEYNPNDVKKRAITPVAQPTYKQQQRKIKSRSSKQPLSQSHKFNKKDLQIISSYQPSYLGNQPIYTSKTPAQQRRSPMNPQSYIGPIQTHFFQSKKFQKPQTAQSTKHIGQNAIHYQHINMFTNNLLDQSQDMSNHSTNKVKTSLNKHQDSTIKFIEPKIQISKVDESLNQNQVDFYSTKMLNLGDSPNNQEVLHQSPDFQNQYQLNAGSPVNKQKLNFDKESVLMNPQGNNNNSKVMKDLTDKQPIPNNQAGRTQAPKLARKNTRFDPIEEQKYSVKNQPKIGNQKSQVKNKELQQANAEKAIALLKNQKKIKEKAIHNAKRFIEILKQRVIYKKARMMQENNKKDRQVVGSLLGGLLGVNTSAAHPEGASISVRYSQDSFDLQDQGKYDGPKVEDKEAYEKYLQQNRANQLATRDLQAEEELIIQKGRKILNSLKLKIKTQKLEQNVKKFIEILREKVIETKQKEVVKKMFAKRFQARNLQKVAIQINKKEENSIIKQREEAKEKEEKAKQLASQFISNIQQEEDQQVDKSLEIIKKMKSNVQNHNNSHKQRNTQEHFNQMSKRCQQIVKGFINLLQRKVQIKVLVKKFIKVFKEQCQSKSKQISRMTTKREELKIFKNFATKFMIYGITSKQTNQINENDQEESISHRYSDDDHSIKSSIKSINEQDKKEIQDDIMRNQVENQSRQQPTNYKRSSTVQNSQSQNMNGIAQTDEEKAMLNSNQFITQIKTSQNQKQDNKVLVKKFVGIIKKNHHEVQVAKKAFNQMKSSVRNKQNFRMNTVFSLSSKSKKSFHSAQTVGISQIKDHEFHDAVKIEFRRLMARIFQLKENQRNTSIFVLYYTFEFKQRAMMLLQRAFKKNYGKKDEERAMYEDVRRFIFINQLRQKYLIQKGKMKAKEYVFRLRFLAQRKRNLKSQLLYLLEKNKENKDKALKYFIARLFQQKSYQAQVCYNPFVNNNLFVTDVKMYIAQLFQNQCDLIGRPRNIFKISNITPSQRQIRSFIAKQFQIKSYKIDQVKQMKVIGILKQKSSVKKQNALKFTQKLRASRQQLNIIKNQDIQDQIFKEFRIMLAKILTRNIAQRESRLEIHHITSKCVEEVLAIIRKYYKLNVSKKLTIKEDFQAIKGFLILNELRLKLRKDKGVWKAKEFMDILRYKIERNKNLKALIYLLLSQVSFKDQRIKQMKIALAMLFQQKSYKNYKRYDPFDQVSLQTRDIRLYIADMFQNNRNLQGRPINIFQRARLNKTFIITKRKVKFYLAKLFQQKRYVSVMKDVIDKFAIPKPKQNSLKMLYNKMKATKEDFIGLKNIKDQEFMKQVTQEFKKLFVKLFQLDEKERESRVYYKYFAQDFVKSVLHSLDLLMQRLQKQQAEPELIQAIKGFIQINVMRIKDRRQKGGLKAIEYMNRLRFFTERNKNWAKQIRYNLDICQNDVQRYQFIRLFIAKVFLRKSYEESVRTNPFKFNKLTVRQVKLFVTDLFQNNKNLVGRPLNIFAKARREGHMCPSQREIREYVAKTLQVKNKGKIISDVVAKMKNRPNQSQFQKMYQKVKAKTPEIIGIKNIKDPIFNTLIFTEFKRFLTKILQRRANQRGSQIFTIYLAQGFVNKTLTLMQELLKRLESKRQEATLQVALRGFLLLNNLKQKYQKEKALRKSKEYLNRLSFNINRKKNWGQQIKFCMVLQKTYLQKLKFMKRYIASLFQSKTYRQSVRENPFKYNHPTEKQVKLFICDLFQNKHNLLGRTANFFKWKLLKITEQKVRYFIAMRFQQKHYMYLDSKIYNIYKRVKTIFLVKRFSDYVMIRIRKIREKNNNLAAEMMKVLNEQLALNTSTDQTNSFQKYGINNMESISLGDINDSDQSISPEEKLMLSKMLSSSKQHIDEAKKDIKQKVGMFKNQMQKNFAKGMIRRISNNQVDVSSADLQNLANILQRNIKEEHATDNAKKFIQNIKTQQSQQERTAQNVKTFADKFKKNYGRAKIIEEE
ncbi:UNKNOWN [Stylonychia lemnae]|uniref:Uncharacterized protein n=1 Tax=Stylonychia lemnae TaxID=5949 RepID=A0A078A8L3_STYLE|nr:UNKNOWN [Stylonychia lemnae]|eukprot:CDW77131.1 UNKNOWN [Stylonychia lemnae]